ncbi:hypothetical protein [Stenotrophomonas oahuensis]|uniref:PepSY domain-containing protein n=1 Tax=Stenotrophomonas oahuensis TaxID=3003271 RepID=A0ABY9YNU9_9GAMM|nr:hypothetical protein [Stenotrophomonas sp. A5586]WNH52305.1 hypothetical protein PDM29_18550 [Stenotrophomonas sp. A5586]
MRTLFGTTTAASLALALSFGSMSSQRNESTSQPDTCRSIVKRYIEETRGWTVSQYTVKEEAVEVGLPGYEVMFLDDLTVPPPEELLSFHVELDPACMRVVRELGYQ